MRPETETRYLQVGPRRRGPRDVNPQTCTECTDEGARLIGFVGLSRLTANEIVFCLENHLLSTAFQQGLRERPCGPTRRFTSLPVPSRRSYEAGSNWFAEEKSRRELNGVSGRRLFHPIRRVRVACSWEPRKIHPNYVQQKRLWASACLRIALPIVVAKVTD